MFYVTFEANFSVNENNPSISERWMFHGEETNCAGSKDGDGNFINKVGVI
jgi:hypothetical protein